jgi:DUF1016 N-terminal domain
MADKKVVRKNAAASALATDLLGDVRALIESARAVTAQAVNSALVLLYWSIGDRIRRDILQEKRAEYGKQIVATLSQKLVQEYGKGYTADNLSRMAKLAEVFPEREIVTTLLLEQKLRTATALARQRLKDTSPPASSRGLRALRGRGQRIL